MRIYFNQPHTLTKNNNDVGIDSWFMSTLTKNYVHTWYINHDKPVQSGMYQINTIYIYNYVRIIYIYIYILYMYIYIYIHNYVITCSSEIFTVLWPSGSLPQRRVSTTGSSSQGCWSSSRSMGEHCPSIQLSYHHKIPPKKQGKQEHLGNFRYFTKIKKNISDITKHQNYPNICKRKGSWDVG